MLDLFFFPNNCSLAYGSHCCNILLVTKALTCLADGSTLLGPAGPSQGRSWARTPENSPVPDGCRQTGSQWRQRHHNKTGFQGPQEDECGWLCHADLLLNTTPTCGMLPLLDETLTCSYHDCYSARPTITCHLSTSGCLAAYGKGASAHPLPAEALCEATIIDCEQPELPATGKHFKDAFQARRSRWWHWLEKHRTKVRGGKTQMEGKLCQNSKVDIFASKQN